MKTKARSDSIRKRRNIEEKYSWDRLSNSDDERRSHRIRAIIATAIVIFFFSTYMVKLYRVQVSNHEYYSVKSDSNRIRIRPIQATRGVIYDRHGEVLAENINTFNLVASDSSFYGKVNLDILSTEINSKSSSETNSNASRIGFISKFKLSDNVNFLL